MRNFMFTILLAGTAVALPIRPNDQVSADMESTVNELPTSLTVEARSKTVPWLTFIESAPDLPKLGPDVLEIGQLATNALEIGKQMYLDPKSPPSQESIDLLQTVTNIIKSYKLSQDQYAEAETKVQEQMRLQEEENKAREDALAQSKVELEAQKMMIEEARAAWHAEQAVKAASAEADMQAKTQQQAHDLAVDRQREAAEKAELAEKMRLEAERKASKSAVFDVTLKELMAHKAEEHRWRRDAGDGGCSDCV
jgi:hypothetical protein